MIEKYCKKCYYEHYCYSKEDKHFRETVKSKCTLLVEFFGDDVSLNPDFGILPPNERFCLECKNVRIEFTHIFKHLKIKGFSNELIRKIWYDNRFQFMCCNCFTFFTVLI